MTDEVKQRQPYSNGETESDVWHPRDGYTHDESLLKTVPQDGSCNTLPFVTDAESSSEEVRFRRLLGVPHGIGIICGLIIGSGIYISPKGVVREMGSVGLSLVIWLVAGVKAAIGASVLTELGTTFPRSGSMYSYLYELCGPFWAFLFSWMYVVMLRPGSNAVKCLIFGKYVLQPFYQDCEPPQASVTLIAVCLACFSTVLNSLRIQWAARAQVVFALLSFTCLTVISITGLIYIFGYGYTEHLSTGFQGSTPEPDNIVVAVISGGFAYAGWSALSFMVDELKDPYRSLPRAIFISLGIITIFYFFVNLSYLAILGTEGVLEADAVAVRFGQRTLGPGAWIIGIFIAISTAGSYNSGLLITSRLTFIAAKNGHLPRVLALINTTYKSPMVSLISQCIGIIIITLWGNIYTIISAVGLTYTNFDILATCGLMYHRWKYPNYFRPIKFPLIVLIIYLIIEVIQILIPTISRPLLTLSSIGYVVCTGVPFYIIFVLWEKRPKSLERATESFIMLVQKLLMSIPEEGEGPDKF